MKNYVNLVVVVFLMLFPCAMVLSQGEILKPAWTMTLGRLYDVSDSTIVTARNDTVTVHDAYTGSVVRIWTVPYGIYGVCLPKHKRGVTLLRIESESDESMVTISDYNDFGVLEAVDTLFASADLVNDTYAYRILCVSQGGNFIVTENGILLNRKFGSSGRITSDNLVHASFSYNDTFVSYLYGRRWYGMRGDLHDDRTNEWKSVDSSTKSCHFIAPVLYGPSIRQFVPGTSELLVDNETIDVCSGQVITQLPRTLNGVICDNGLRTVGYEVVDDSRLRKSYHLVLTDIETNARQYIEADLYGDPMFVGGHSFKMSPSGEIIVARTSVANVYIAAKLTTEPRLSMQHQPARLTEHTMFAPDYFLLPINAGLKIAVEIDGRPLTGGLSYLSAGSHPVHIKIADSYGLRASYDTTIVVDTLPSIEFASWTGRFSNSYGIDLSPSGQKIAACGKFNVVVDIDGDSACFVEKPLAEWLQSHIVSFATDVILVFSRYTLQVDRMPGPTQWYNLEKWRHRLLLMSTAQWDEKEQRFESYSTDIAKSVYFHRYVDRRHGRVSLFMYTTNNYGKFQSELVVGEPGSSKRDGCQANFNSLAFDPSQDNPLFVHSSTDGGGVWRKKGGKDLCGDSLALPAEAMIFVNEGRLLWSGKGIYDGRTGELVRSVRLPGNIQAVPHTSLVVATNVQSAGGSDSTSFVFLHSSSGDTAGRVIVRGRLSAFVFDTAGRRMMVKNVTDTVWHILDITSMLKRAGLDTFYVSTPLPPDEPPSANDSTPIGDSVVAGVHSPSFPNPAVDWVEFLFSNETSESNTLVVVSEFGTTMVATNVERNDKHYRWNLLTSSGQRVAPGMYGFLLRTIDGRILESGTFIVAPE